MAGIEPALRERNLKAQAPGKEVDQGRIRSAKRNMIGCDGGWCGDRRQGRFPCRKIVRVRRTGVVLSIWRVSTRVDRNRPGRNRCAHTTVHGGHADAALDLVARVSARGRHVLRAAAGVEWGDRTDKRWRANPEKAEPQDQHWCQSTKHGRELQLSVTLTRGCSIGSLMEPRQVRRFNAQAWPANRRIKRRFEMQAMRGHPWHLSPAELS